MPQDGNDDGRQQLCGPSQQRRHRLQRWCAAVWSAFVSAIRATLYPYVVVAMWLRQANQKSDGVLLHVLVFVALFFTTGGAIRSILSHYF